MNKPSAWLKELIPEEGMEWQVKMTTVEEVAKDWEEPVTPLYPKKEWIGLTEEEVIDCWPGLVMHMNSAEFWKNIEAKLKEKNA